MSRNLKLTGHAAVAVLAFAAVNVSAASAVLFHKTNMGPTVITGGQVTQNVFEFPEITWQCEEVTFGSETEETTPATLTVNPEFGKCRIAGDPKGAKVNMNGCDYVLHANGETDVVCPEGKTIVITIALLKCTITIGAQTGLKSLEYTNNADGTVTVTSAIAGIRYTMKGSGGAVCQETTEGVGATYTGSVKLEGTIGGSPERIWVE